MMNSSASGKPLLEIRDMIVKLLAAEGCTVQQARYVLDQASRAITATASVQPIEAVNYEF